MSLKLMSAIIQTSNTSQASSNHREEADKLLKKLLNYVKECQKRYGGKTELATEFDNCVAGLCSSLELVFSHGLRTKPQEVVSQNFTLKQMSEIVSSSLSFNNDIPSFWPFVKHHLTKHEQERYSVLRHIWTDNGRGRAWIRSALNERSLERYLHSLFSNQELVNRYYEEWAFLCDQEKNSMLPNMAAGLASILFAVSIDKPELNKGDIIKVKNINEPIINTTEPESKTTEKKKRKRVAPQIISFDSDDATFNQNISDSSDIPSNSSINIPNSSETKENLSVSTIDSEFNDNISQNVSSSQKSAIKTNIIKSSIDVCEHHDITLTPVQHSEIGDLTLVPTDHSQFSSDSPLDDEAIEVSMDIAAVLQTMENKSEENNTLQMKISSLTTENDNLRQQLKKYISAVQMLYIDSKTAHRILASLSLNDANSDEPNYLIEAKMYENKLVQVAEMHGELMEFNEHLQKLLNQKEVSIQRMRKELCDLKGTSPNDEMNEESSTLDSVGLTNICVPSVFLTGTGSEKHHVYQIYIRTGNEDWNIYRRYSQFYALHSDLKKLDPVVATFDFPPKKSIGNKDANLVEDRRKRLQIYLRKIFAHWPELGNCNNRFLLEQHLSFFREDPSANKYNSKKVTSSRRGNYSSTHDNSYTGL